MNRLPGVLWIAAGAALWGTDTVLRRPLAGVLGSTQIVLYEHVILSFIVLPIIHRDRAYLSKIPLRIWLAVVGTAWIGSALATVLFTSAIGSGNPTTAVLLQKTQPLFAILLARIVLRETTPRGFAWIAVVAIVGGYLVVFGNSRPLASGSLEVAPALLALGAAASWAFATVWGRIAVAEVPFELLTALRFVIALPVLIGAALLQRQASVPASEQLPSLLWMALVPGFAALILYYKGLRNTPASQATIAELAFPATAAFLNWWILGVTATILQLAGFLLVWAAILQLSRTPVRQVQQTV